MARCVPSVLDAISVVLSDCRPPPSLLCYSDLLTPWSSVLHFRQTFEVCLCVQSVLEVAVRNYTGYGVVVLNLFIIVLCGFVYRCNVWGCVCVGFVLYGCVRLM